jgi:hypothetical protein
MTSLHFTHVRHQLIRLWHSGVTVHGIAGTTLFSVWYVGILELILTVSSSMEPELLDRDISQRFHWPLAGCLAALIGNSISLSFAHISFAEKFGFIRWA